MSDKKKFIEFTFEKKALKFGEFQLKSGRISPYFFNSGLLSTGKDILNIGILCAHFIMNLKIEFDFLFGSAYKGITLAVATAIALNKHYQLNIPYVFNRKEEKKHGEKGFLIGQTIKNKKGIILDDVITSGTEIKNSIHIIEKKGGIVSSIVVLLDRQEKEKKTTIKKTVHSIKKYKINSIITMKDLILFIQKDKILKKYIPILLKYRKKYGIDSYEKNNIF